ncbi:hypothetical protein IAU60_004201 [Kwoniella sp. DSM 27419]
MSEASRVRRFIPIPTQYQSWLTSRLLLTPTPSSYTVDPQWQITFTLIWTTVLALSLACSLPYIARAIRCRRLYAGLAITESLDPVHAYTAPSSGQGDGASSQSGGAMGRPHEPPSQLARLAIGTRAIVQSAFLWTPPMPRVRGWPGQVGDCCRRAYFTLSLGQMVLVAGYMTAAVACFTVAAQLTQNANRPGFIALSQLPVIILLSLKSPLPLPIFLPSLSYEHYNFVHRWAGRTLFLSATVHGGLWINQFIRLDEWDQIASDKSKRGMVAYGMMGLVVVTSLKPVRRMCYQLFWLAHVTFFVGFFAAISYHTPYSRPWVYPCAAIYGYDLLVRMLRYRLKDAVLVPVDETMTMIHIPDCDAGWLPTQHVFLRVLKGSGVFESHPFTITNAPGSGLDPGAVPRGIILYAKVSGGWTRKLHGMASDPTVEVGGGGGDSDDDDGDDGDDARNDKDLLLAEKSPRVLVDARLAQALRPGPDHPGKRVQVMLDGPYGGLKVDLGSYENVLLVGGGSGITFVLGAIEEALRVRSGATTATRGPARVDVAWVVRDLSTVRALAPTLRYLHVRAQGMSPPLAIAYNLHLSLPPSPLPALPSGLPRDTTLSPYRPEIAQLVRQALPLAPLVAFDGAQQMVRSAEEAQVERESIDQVNNPAEDAIRAHGQTGGGLVVVACGPEGLVSEARNAVASLSLAERVRAGGVAFHGECYAL